MTINYDGTLVYGNGAVYLNVDSVAGWRSSGNMGNGTGTGYKSVLLTCLRSTVRGIPWGDRQTSATLYGGKFRAEVTGLCLYGSTGYDGGLVWDLQPGGTLNGALSWGVTMTELSTTAIPAYYFFQDGDTVTVVVEYTAGKYQWFCFGCLEKQGVYTGGQFFSGSLGSYEPTFQILAA